MYRYGKVLFDDITKKAEDGLNDWSQICQHCVDKHGIDIKKLDLNAGHGICGVSGCKNESDHYIDFEDGELTIDEESIEWAFEIGAVVEVDTESVDGTNVGDKFEVMSRIYDDNQYFNLKRTTDGQVWEGVGVSSIL